MIIFIIIISFESCLFIDSEYIFTHIVAIINIQINKIINSFLEVILRKKIIIISENKEPIVPGAHLTYPIKKSVENI